MGFASQKSHFYHTKVALLKAQNAVLSSGFCSFRNILCLILHNKKAYSIHTYTHNSILTADRQKDKYCTQKVPLFASTCLLCRKMQILACFTVRKLTIQGSYFAHINKLNRYSLQYNEEQPRHQTLPYFTVF